MGPDFPLQRVVLSGKHLKDEPERAPGADCETRSPNDPNFEQRETRTIPLISDDEFIFTCSGRF